VAQDTALGAALKFAKEPVHSSAHTEGCVFPPARGLGQVASIFLQPLWVSCFSSLFPAVSTLPCTAGPLCCWFLMGKWHSLPPILYLQRACTANRVQGPMSPHAITSAAPLLSLLSAGRGLLLRFFVLGLPGIWNGLHPHLPGCFPQLWAEILPHRHPSLLWLLDLVVPVCLLPVHQKYVEYVRAKVTLPFQGFRWHLAWGGWVSRCVRQ
jgi:hypothetical protein